MNKSTNLDLALKVTAASIGCLAAWFLIGNRSESNVALKAASEQFTTLPAESQETIREAFEDFSKLSPERKQELLQLHQEVEQDPELQERLNQFQSWWESLSTTDWQELTPVVREGDAKAISSRIFDDAQAADKIAVVFSMRRLPRQRSSMRLVSDDLADPESSTRIPPLVLSLNEYSRLMETAFPDSQLSGEEQEELNAYSSLEDRTLYKSLVFLQRLLKTNRPEDAFRVIQPFGNALRTEVPDSEWREKFAQQFPVSNDSRSRFEGVARYRQFLEVLHAFSVIDQAIVDLGGNLSDSVATDEDDLVQAFSSLEDRRDQKWLITMTPEQARRRLKQMAETNNGIPDNPRSRLLLLRNRYEESVNDLFRRILPVGPGGPGGPGGPPREPPPEMRQGIPPGDRGFGGPGDPGNPQRPPSDQRDRVPRNPQPQDL